MCGLYRTTYNLNFRQQYECIMDLIHKRNPSVQFYVFQVNSN